MLNESNNLLCLQKYIIKTLVQFFSNPSEVVTSRYVLYFDSRENIINFDTELRKYIEDGQEVELLKAKLGEPNIDVSIMSNYLFFNDEGKIEYEATQFRIANGDIERILVFIPDFDRNGTLLGDAFKNNIRNKFVDDGEDKILFYLSVQNIASVSKTTENFQRQGMPLSINNVYEYLSSQVHIVQGTNQQKVLCYSLDKIKSNKPLNDNSLLEFAPIMRIIESQELVQDDFHDLHMFPMSLTDLGRRDCNLAENYRLYRIISLALNDQELESAMSSYELKIIKDIEKSYEQDEDNWDKKFTFEGIEKYKKTNTKKFKLEQPIVLLDKDDNEVAKDFYIDFTKANSASFIIFTKEYVNEKNFKIQIKFTQKATVTGTPDFVVEQISTKGNAYKILLNKSVPYYQGKVTFVGGKKAEFTVYVSVMNAPAGFLADSCVGMREEKSGFVYQLESRDYTLTLGNSGDITNFTIETQGKTAISWPVNTSKQTKIKFSHSEDEAIKDFSFKMDLDDQSTQIILRVRFTEDKLRVLELYELFNRCFVGHNTFSVDEEKIYNKNKRSEKYCTSEFDVSGYKYKLNDLLLLETEIILSKMIFCKTSGLKNPKSVDLLVPKEIKDVIYQIYDCYLKLDTIPSLCCLNDELVQLYEKYIDVVLKYIGKDSTDFVDKKGISTEVLNIFKIGTIVDADKLIWLSPINPLSVAYQLELARDDTRLVELDDYLYSSLGFGNSLPFIEDENGVIYQSIKGAFPLQWACFCDAAQSIKGEESTFANKIQDYYSKFGYLFKDSANNRIIINVINIQHTSELINALLKLYKVNTEISQVSIEINYYFNGTGKNDFEQMCDGSYVEKIAATYYGVRNIELIEGFCDWYSDKVFYYAMQDKIEYKYAHISFCAMQGDNNKSLHNTIASAESGIMLEGLISDVPSYLDKESGIYKYGYGAQYTDEVLASSRYLQIANALNELAKCKEGSTAIRNLSIAQGVQNTKSEKLERIYKASNWVVFVEPKIDLDFFIKQSEKQDEDLIIIHYPDKNVSSAGYTSITVTQKSEQYINVIRDIMHRELPMYSGNMDIKRVICDFNAYSGEWLMHFINQKQLEEKVSLVAAIDFCREYFMRAYPEYIWVPIALDEILRVTGSIGGSLTNVLFSKKVLVNRGIIDNQNATSDDIMMAGIRSVDGKVHITYIPIEVKHGKCGSDIRVHAHQQVINTADLIEKSFLDDSSEAKQNIDKKIYRNYMIQHVISNIEKMIAYGIADEAIYKQLIASKTRICLINDLYILDFSPHLDKYVFYFIEGTTITDRQQNDKDKVIEIFTPLKNMYEFLINQELVESEVELLLGNDMVVDSTDYEISLPGEDLDEEDEEFSDVGDKESRALSNRLEKLTERKENTILHDVQKNEIEKMQVVDGLQSLNVPEKEDEESIEEKTGIRILLGSDDRSGEDVIWRPNDTSQLFHTNTGIIGTMGTGKTQFTKSLITQMYRNQAYNVDGQELGILIFDYKGDYNESKPDFIDATKATILKPYHLPFNPLTLTQSKVFKPLLPIHTANAFKDTLTKIYNLGAKQQDTLLQCINETYADYGIKPADKDTWSNVVPTFDQVYQRYVNDEEIKKNDSLAAAMNKLHQFEVFESNPSETKSLFELLKGVVVIDLSGYDSDIQSLIVAITLDLFYAQMQAAGSSKMVDGFRQLTKMILVDEADNFMSEGFPALKKILKEGREFGVGTILSTQFLKHFGSGEDDYSKYILTWIVHNVSDLKSSDVDFVFNTEPKSSDSNALFNQIKGLKIHHSIIKIGTGRPIYLHDKPFWELYQETKN
ncbi:MAG: DUF87 domain-containing protein [Lachnospiraceae bacterium]|nr:DUF87 domain-containing protein [Lachnospiraceae bacterium]